MLIITANGLFLTAVDSMGIEALAAMINYLDSFHLDGALFKIGHKEMYLTREEIMSV